MFRVEEASQKYHVYPFSAPQDKALSDIPAPGVKPSATGPRSALEDIKLMRWEDFTSNTSNLYSNGRHISPPLHPHDMLTSQGLSLSSQLMIICMYY
jgi:hypothetical protein